MIDPKKTYSLKEICDAGWLGTTDRFTCHRRITNDMLGDELLNVEIRGLGNKRRYYIVGRNLLKYLSNK